MTRTSYLGGGLAKQVILTQTLTTVSKQYLAYMDGETGIVGEEALDLEAVLQMLKDMGLKIKP